MLFIHLWLVSRTHIFNVMVVTISLYFGRYNIICKKCHELNIDTRVYGH